MGPTPAALLEAWAPALIQAAKEESPFPQVECGVKGRVKEVRSRPGWQEQSAGQRYSWSDPNLICLCIGQWVQRNVTRCHCFRAQKVQVFQSLYPFRNPLESTQLKHKCASFSINSTSRHISVFLSPLHNPEKNNCYCKSRIYPSQCFMSHPAL